MVINLIRTKIQNKFETYDKKHIKKVGYLFQQPTFSTDENYFAAFFLS